MLYGVWWALNGGCCMAGVKRWVLNGGQNGECCMVGFVWWVLNGGCFVVSVE